MTRSELLINKKPGEATASGAPVFAATVRTARPSKSRKTTNEKAAKKLRPPLPWKQGGQSLH
jgi:hypothetical protein